MKTPAMPNPAANDDNSRKRLGKGLAALLGEVSTEAETVDRARSQRRVPIESIFANPRNPRRSFKSDDLDDLARSIREKGVVQPILVRPFQDQENRYEIIAGERRWRAAQQAGLHELPVLIQMVSDSEALELAIIENVQRADLDPIEEALGYQQLMADFSYGQQDVAQIIGKSRSHVANLLRLLNLPQTVQDYLQDGSLTIGHAKILVAADDPASLADEIVHGSLSVRNAEALVREGGTKAKPKSSSGPLEKDPDTLALEKSLSEALGLIIDLRHKPNETGELRIKYKSLNQLEYVAGKLGS